MRQHPPPLRWKSPFSARNCLNLGLWTPAKDPTDSEIQTTPTATPLQISHPCKPLPDPKTFPRHSQDAPSPKTKATLSGMHTNPQQHPKYFTPQTPHPLQTSAQTLQTPHRPLPNPSRPLPNPSQTPSKSLAKVLCR